MNRPIFIMLMAFFTLPAFAWSNAAASPPLDGGTFTVRPPAGDGWQAMPGDDKFKFQFHNPKLSAWAFVASESIPETVPDAHKKLDLLLEQLPGHLEAMNYKILFFAKDPERHDETDCFSVRAILEPKQVSGKNVSMHLLQCIYNNKTSVKLQFMYLTTGVADPLGPQAEEFFAGLHFKNAGRK